MKLSDLRKRHRGAPPAPPPEPPRPASQLLHLERPPPPLQWLSLDIASFANGEASAALRDWVVGQVAWPGETNIDVTSTDVDDDCRLFSVVLSAGLLVQVCSLRRARPDDQSTIQFGVPSYAGDTYLKPATRLSASRAQAVLFELVRSFGWPTTLTGVVSTAVEHKTVLDVSANGYECEAIAHWSIPSERVPGATVVRLEAEVHPGCSLAVSRDAVVALAINMVESDK